MTEGFGPQLEPRTESLRDKSLRDESPGEAEMRLAAWVKMVLAIFGVRLYPFEEEALAQVMGAFIRRWPNLSKWRAPKK